MAVVLTGGAFAAVAGGAMWATAPRPVGGLSFALAGAAAIMAGGIGFVGGRFAHDATRKP